MERTMTSRPRRPFTLILDWDGTITMSDTTALIGSHCLAKAQSLSEAAGESSKSSPRPMSYYSDAYMADYKAWKVRQNIRNPEASRATLEHELELLDSMTETEHASFARVRHAILEAPGMQDFVADRSRREAWMQEAGARTVRTGELKLRDSEGLRSLLRRAEQDGNSWAIVSVSWSRSFIVGALREAGLLRDSEKQPLGQIWCNELTAPDGETGAGPQCRAVHAAGEKKAVFEDLVSRQRHEERPTATCYVGDSTTDLACLADADFGICMRDVTTNPEDDKLGRTLERVNIGCHPVLMQPESEKDNDAQLFWTTNFRDIEQFLFS